MKRIVFLIVCLGLGGSLFANHWEPDPHQFPTNMNVIGVIEINGIEQTTVSLELGAFYGEECRGSQMLDYYPSLDRYMVFMTLYGENGNVFTFRLYDHETQQELDLTCSQTITYYSDAIIGALHDPYVFAFSGGSSCAISTSASPEEGGTTTGDGTYMVGETCTVSASPNSGYYFTSWKENNVTVSTESEYRFAVMSDRSLTACFERVTYTIDVRPMPDTAGMVTGAGVYYENDNCTVSAAPYEGYSFDNWTEDGTIVSMDSDYSFAVTSDRSLTANFLLNSYSITAESQPNEGGTITGTGEYDYGSTATLIAIPNETYFFINWMENGELVSTQAEYSFLVREDHHLVATFAQSCFVVEADADPVEGGIIIGAGNYVEGSTCHLEAVPANGYAFVSWTEDGEVVSMQPVYSFVVESDHHLVAHFEIEYYEIVATADPEYGGSVEGMGSFTYGQTATLSAMPNENYVFQHWTENGNVVSENANYSFTVVGSRSLVAHFYYYDKVADDETQWSIFPNPTEGMLKIEGFPQSVVCLFDANGRLIYSVKTVSDEESLDLSRLPSGWYLLQIQSSQGLHCQKLFKR